MNSIKQKERFGAVIVEKLETQKLLNLRFPYHVYLQGANVVRISVLFS